MLLLLPLLLLFATIKSLSNFLSPFVGEGVGVKKKGVVVFEDDGLSSLLLLLLLLTFGMSKVVGGVTIG